MGIQSSTVIPGPKIAQFQGSVFRPDGQREFETDTGNFLSN